METSLASLCVTVAKLEVLLSAHLKWHDQVFWMIIIPVCVGVIIGAVNHITLRKFIRNGGGKKDGA